MYACVTANRPFHGFSRHLGWGGGGGGSGLNYSVWDFG